MAWSIVSFLVAGGLAAVALLTGLGLGSPSVSFGPDAAKVLSRDSSDLQDAKAADHRETFVFAAGCFWGPELAMARVPGVITTEVGYAGGQVHQPSYTQVCAGGTGHREAVRVAFNAAVVSLRELLDVYWDTLKDPADAGGQGNDRGESYTAALFAQSADQRRVFEVFLAEKQQNATKSLAIPVLDFTNFYAGEDYHQQYLEKHGQTAAKGDLTPIRCYG